VTGLRWWWLRWRVRHYVLVAQQNYAHWPTSRNAAVWARAVKLLERVEASRP
jgi:hypothetical protein